MTEPLPEILDREIPVRDVQKHYARQLEVLRDMVNYGSNLIPRCYTASEHGVADVVVLSSLVKHAVAMLDCIEVCVSSAACLGSHAPLRVLFECALYVDWILDAETDIRAKRYYVAELRSRKLSANRVIADTDDYAAFAHVLSALTLDQNELDSHARNEVAQIEKLLQSSTYCMINSEFDLAKGDKKYDPHWYQLPKGSGAPTSIRQLSQKLGRLAAYDVVYSRLSGVVHSSSFGSHVRVGKGEVTFEPIRHLEDAVFILQIAFGTAIGLYRSVLEHYRPTELPNFNYKYRTEWRQAIQNIPRPRYNVVLTHERPI